MVYGKQEAGSKELVISVKVIPNYEIIEEKHGANLSEEEIKIVNVPISAIFYQLTSLLYRKFVT